MNSGEYQIWCYTEPCFEIAEHKKIADHCSQAYAEERCNELRTENLYKYVESHIADEPYSAQEFYIRKADEPTYLIYVTGKNNTHLYDICFNSTDAAKKMEILETVASKLQDNHNITIKPSIENRDDSDVRDGFAAPIANQYDDTDTDTDTDDIREIINLLYLVDNL